MVNIGFNIGKAKININPKQIKNAIDTVKALKNGETPNIDASNIIQNNSNNVVQIKKEQSGVIGEIIALFTAFGLGVWALLDVIINLIIHMIIYFGFGFVGLARYIKLGSLFVWGHGLNVIYNEIATLFIAAGSGVGLILTTVFYTVPSKVFGVVKEEATIVSNSNKVKARAKMETGVNKITKKENPIIEKIKEYFLGKYESIGFVKEKKEKQMASLKEMHINPNNPDDVYKYPTKQAFKYLVKSKDGKLVTGYFPAYSKMDVYSYLLDEGYVIYEIITSRLINFVHGDAVTFKSSMATKDLVFWLTQLSTYLKAGIPLTDGVKVLAQQDKRTKYKPIYESMIYELTMGATFSDALARQGSAFPAMLVNMIKASEMAGNIEETLDEMANYYQEMEDNKKAIVSAIAYPAVVLVFAVGIVIFMLVYIVPKFADVYDSMGAEINPITQFCLNLSAFLAAKWWIILIIIVSVIVAYIVCFKKVKAFRETMQALSMKLPAIGKLVVAKEISTFTRTFASLQKNNVLIADSIDILAKITQNELYKQLMVDTINNLIKGNKMSETFQNNWIIPDIAYFMITTGESTGELAEMLDKTADYYNKEQKNAISGIKTFIEPVMIIFLAVMVGFILVAILVPMFGIYSTVAM